MPFYTRKQSINLLIDKLLKRRIIVGKCWRFKGAHDTGGYGQLSFCGKLHLVHRLSAYISLCFDLNSKALICHRDDLCKFKDCWNPLHIYIGNGSTNQLDSIRKGTHNFANITHCLNGHEFTEENTYNMKGGGRECRKCGNKRRQEYRERKQLINKQNQQSQKE